jgi:hypothetical protein
MDNAHSACARASLQYRQGELILLFGRWSAVLKAAATDPIRGEAATANALRDRVTASADSVCG